MENMNEQLEQQMANRLEKKLKSHVKRKILKIVIPVVVITVLVGVIIGISLISALVQSFANVDKEGNGRCDRDEKIVQRIIKEQKKEGVELPEDPGRFWCFGNPIKKLDLRSNTLLTEVCYDDGVEVEEQPKGNEMIEKCNRYFSIISFYQTFLLVNCIKI